MRASHVLLAAVLIVPAVIGAQLTIRPGEYEYELQMNLGPGSAEAEKAILDAAGADQNKRRECITADDLKDKDFMKLLAAEMEDANCKISDTKTTGNKLTYTATCVEDGMRMTLATEMTFGHDSFSGITKGKDYEGRPVGMTISAKRIGDCKK